MLHKNSGYLLHWKAESTVLLEVHSRISGRGSGEKALKEEMLAEAQRSSAGREGIQHIIKSHSSEDLGCQHTPNDNRDGLFHPLTLLRKKINSNLILTMFTPWPKMASSVQLPSCLSCLEDKHVGKVERRHKRLLLDSFKNQIYHTKWRE